MELKLKWAEHSMYGLCTVTKFGVVSVHWTTDTPPRTWDNPNPAKGESYFYVNYPERGKGKARYETVQKAQLGAEATLRQWARELITQLGED